MDDDRPRSGLNLPSAEDLLLVRLADTLDLNPRCALHIALAAALERWPGKLVPFPEPAPEPQKLPIPQTGATGPICADPEGCNWPVHARDLCAKHYQRVKERVRRGETTWSVAEAQGACGPAKRMTLGRRRRQNPGPP